MNKKTIVDIIIPCYNEGHQIHLTLSRIKSLFELYFPYHYNLLVVDNGSTDNSIETVKGCDVNYVEKKDCKVSELRNFGASFFNSEYIAFIDADVLITRAWIDELIKIIQTNKDKLLLTGSKCNIYTEKTLLNMCWFSEKSIRNKYINSGNLLVTRYLFNSINGFDPKLYSGEDYDFCRRSKVFGAKININLNLYTIHYDYPDSLLSFFKREVWHGVGDFQSFKAFFKSKPAMLSIFNFSILILFLIHAFYADNVIYLFFYLSIVLCISLYHSISKSSNLKCIPFNMMVSYIYLWARFLSIYKLFLIAKKKPTR